MVKYLYLHISMHLLSDQKIFFDHLLVWNYYERFKVRQTNILLLLYKNDFGNSMICLCCYRKVQLPGRSAQQPSLKSLMEKYQPSPAEVSKLTIINRILHGGGRGHWIVNYTGTQSFVHYLILALKLLSNSYWFDPNYQFLSTNNFIFIRDDLFIIIVDLHQFIVHCYMP